MGKSDLEDPVTSQGLRRVLLSRARQYGAFRPHEGV